MESFFLTPIAPRAAVCHTDTICKLSTKVLDDHATSFQSAQMFIIQANADWIVSRNKKLEQVMFLILQISLGSTEDDFLYLILC